MMHYNGLLNVYKEAGFTSHDVVAKLRGILKQKKIGHTGTLDPAAVGVLVVCLGTATKLCETLTEHTKEYIATMQLGIRTDTEDMTGRILDQEEVDVSLSSLKETLSSLQGTSFQVPPMYSAIKVDGRKLYELAREGKEVVRRPRKIEIFSIQLLDTSELAEKGRFTMEVRCSKGTYIRSLCRDIGDRLGCGGCMASLVRSAVGAFHLEDARTLSEIEELRDQGELESLILPPEEIFRDLDLCLVKEAFTGRIDNGNALLPSYLIPEQGQEPSFQDGQRVRICRNDGVFYGVYRYEKAGKKLLPDKLFLPH